MNLVFVSWTEVIIQHLLMEDLCQRPCLWWDDPHPVRRASSPHFVLLLEVFHELLGLRVMIDDRDVLPDVGGEDRDVHLSVDLVSPEARRGGRVKTKFPTNDLVGREGGI